MLKWPLEYPFLLFPFQLQTSHCCWLFGDFSPDYGNKLLVKILLSFKPSHSAQTRLPKVELRFCYYLNPIRHLYGLWTKIQTLQPELKALPDLIPPYLWVWFSNIPSSCYKSVHSQNTFSTSIIILGRRIESELWRKSIWIQDLASPLTQDFSKCHQDVFWRESNYNWLMDCKRGIRKNESKERPRFLAWDVGRTKALWIPRGEWWGAGERARGGVQLRTPDARVSVDTCPSRHSSAIISFERHHKFCLLQLYPSLRSSGHCFLPCWTVRVPVTFLLLYTCLTSKRTHMWITSTPHPNR